MQNKMRAEFIRPAPALREVTLQVNAVGGINLGQGICQMPVPDLLIAAAQRALAAGRNRYAAPQGVSELRQAISRKLSRFNGLSADPDHIIVTNGATGAFETICNAFLGPGDEVVSFVPFYPYHHNPLKSRNAAVRYVPLRAPRWDFDREELARAFSGRTKFIVVCTPNNPTGKVFTREELEFIGALCQRHGAVCVSDEVYEYMTYDGNVHVSPATIPALAGRTITMGSYSKTFSITGWRIGYLAAPQSAVEILRTIADQVYVCAPTPFQYAAAEAIEKLPQDYYSGLLRDYTRKRALMHEALSGAGFAALLPQGAYYMIAQTSERFPGLSSEEAVQKMIAEAGVGAVPASDFLGIECKGDAQRSNFMRFCYALPDEKIKEAGERLRRLS